MKRSAFAAVTGLRRLWVALAEQQLVEPAVFHAGHYPLAFYVSGEQYMKPATTAGAWLSMQDFLRASTNRTVRFTDPTLQTSRFYRLLVRP